MFCGLLMSLDVLGYVFAAADFRTAPFAEVVLMVFL